MVLDLSPLADLIAERLQLGGAQPEILSTKQAAEFLQVSERTINIWANDGVIPGRLLEGRWRFTRRSLLTHIEGGAA